MMQRCYLQTNHAFQSYGGRGIKVCDKWHKFEGFYADMGDPPFEGASLDRINNDGNYEPGNVRWATSLEQARNNRRNVRYEFRGHNLLLVEWAEMIGLPRATLVSRVCLYGWPIERALTEPTRDASAPGRPVIKIPNEIPYADTSAESAVL